MTIQLVSRRALALGVAVVASTSALIGVGVAPAVAAPTGSYTLGIIAGDGSTGSPTSGPATSSDLAAPTDTAVDSTGNVYVADDNYVEKITPAGQLSIIAGDGLRGTTVAGNATSTAVTQPTSIAVDSSGNVYVADGPDSTVDKITPAGQLSFVAGEAGAPGAALTPGTSYTATSTELDYPAGVTISANGTIYVADWDANQIYRITPAGVLTVLAGDGTYSTALPTAGVATDTALSYPYQMAVAPSGDLYATDWYGQAVIKISKAGTLSVVAGSGSSGAAVPGPATSSPLYYPAGIALDSSGNLWIADSYNYEVEKVTPNGTLSIAAGNGTNTAPTAGPATDSSIGTAWGLCLDAAGNIYLPDRNSNYVYELATPNTVPSAPHNLTATAGTNSVTLRFRAPADNGGDPITAYQYSVDGGTTWKTLTTSTSGSVLTAVISNLANGHTYRFEVRAVNAIGSGAASTTVSGTPKAPSTSGGHKKHHKKHRTNDRWFVDPLSKTQRRHLAHVPAHPDSVHGAARVTKADYRTHDGSLAVPLSTVRGHQLAHGQSVQVTRLFAFNSADLTRAGRTRLRTLAQALRNVRTITCAGYTDYAGDRAHEIRLGRARARSVCAYLRAIDKHTLNTHAASYGPADPVVIGGTVAQRAANRRVDVTVDKA